MENKIEAKNLDLYYGEKHALKNVSLNIKTNKITAFIGPSGCGKSTFLKSLNRMNDLVDGKIRGLRCSLSFHASKKPIIFLYIICPP